MCFLELLPKIIPGPQQFIPIKYIKLKRTITPYKIYAYINRNKAVGGLFILLVSLSLVDFFTDASFAFTEFFLHNNHNPINFINRPLKK